MLENVILAHLFLEILNFPFLYIFLFYFNEFVIDVFVCKFALVSFYTYFQRILAILQNSFIFQTPPQGPSRTPLGPPRTATGPCFFDWGGPRGWSTQLVQTHQTQTVIVANRAAQRNARSG